MGIEFQKIDGIVIAAALAAAASVAWWWRSRGPGALLTLRLSVLLLLLAALARPVIVSRSGDARPRIALAVDVSGSMSLSGRIKAAGDFIERYRRPLERRYRVAYYAVAANGTTVQTPGSFSKLQPGVTTDLVRSLADIRRESGRELAGIVLLSDGNHNGPVPAEGWAKELNVPVFPVSLESGGSIKDLSLRSVRIAEFAFKNIALPVTVQVSASGMAGREAVITLRETSPRRQLLAERRLRFDGARETREEVLDFTPREAGGHSYLVQVRPADGEAGEASTANNEQRFTLDILREKTRVLFLCGQPGPEYAFLRHALKSDPSVELVSFVILRNPENIALVPEYDLALIPFPVHEIFMKDLYDFDVLILQNFTHRRFGFLPQYLENIRRWVLERSGGLVMTGGENSFGSGGWMDTPVGELLPVEPDPSGNTPETGAFSPRLGSFDHPLMRVSDDAAGSGRLWRSAAALDGCEKLREKKGAAVLARHPFGGWPLITVWERGSGRVAAIGTATTWRWALSSTAPELYARFWRSVVRYLSAAGDRQALAVTLDRPAYYDGQEYTFKIRTADTPVSGMPEVSCIDPRGGKTTIALERSAEREWSGKGIFSGTGEYRFECVLHEGGERRSRRTTPVQVAPSKLREESELDLDETFLNTVAEGSGGIRYAVSSFSEDDLASRLKRHQPAPAAGKHGLADTFWFLGIVASALFVEWTVRKRRGMF